MSSKLLLDSRPLVILPELAVAVGLNEAILLQQVHYWCELYARSKSRKYCRNGYYWANYSVREWHEQFPWWKSDGPIKTAFKNLENRGLVITGNYNESSWDHAKWYRVNYVKLEELAIAPLGKIYPIEQIGITQSNLEEINKEKNKNGSFAPQAAKRTRFISDNSDAGDIDLYAFIEWYYILYKKQRGEDHPRIRPTQEQRVIDELTKFLETPNGVGVDTDGLKEMAEDFFETVDSNDWRINHFATQGILEMRYYNVYMH